ncbi:MAG TPA: TetR/AcrR family transcriptional regulator [Thermotogota bacterium]|nr:TetR/AcrR family transcriptional regulator [Thermotogota bacterium]HPJ88826.1 TetR/AcrR family transcriptional regulator [Thermotogota bacterium]HPR96689.1 TetR/AcrR family transcriptional regulator [Thermotogota bacterium]
MSAYVRKSREDRIKEIQAAALKVFLEKGYRHTTMEDIIKATSLSKGGFYHYYKSTKEIIFAMMKRGNYNYLAQFKLSETPTIEEICDLVARMTLVRIQEQTPERSLYVMFACEMLYDDEFRELYRAIEKETFEIIEKKIKKYLPNFKLQDSEETLVFYEHLVNGLLFTRNLFQDKEIMKKQEKRIYSLMYNTCMEFLIQKNT